jgi:peroxiredoxin Q/BCP
MTTPTVRRLVSFPRAGTHVKRFALACLTSTLALPIFAALQANDVAPDFHTQASLAGKTFTFSLQEALKKGPVVVYFYPSAYTGGCNIQAHAFAVNSEKFATAGASIIGVSLDSITRLNDFSADPQYCAGKFPTASDADGKIARSYGLTVREAQEGRKDTRGIEIGHGFAERTTFIVTSNGRIAATVGGLAPADNVDKALEAVQQLAKR